jgi:hypothetical protein
MKFTKAQTNSMQHINTDLFPPFIANFTVSCFKWLVAGANLESIVLLGVHSDIIANIQTVLDRTRRQFSFPR